MGTSLAVNLVAHLWQSTLCVAAAAVLASALRRSPARVRHAIWMCASLKFLVPFAALVAAGTFVGAWTTTTPEVQAVARWLDQSMPRWYLDVSGEASAIARPFAIGRGGVLALTIAWALGVAALTAWRWRQWRNITHLARAATPLEGGREADALRRVPRRSRRPTQITLMLCASRFEPAVLGIVRPAILWPADLSARLTDSELESVLAHEACHVDRRDNLAALIQILIETVFWFHPAVWWIGARLVHERERACDEEVLHMGTDVRRYAEGILKVCGFCLRAPAAFVSGVGSSRLTERIEWIMNRRSVQPRMLTTQLPLAAVMAVAVGAPISAGVVKAHRPGVEPSISSPRAAAVQERKIYRVGNGVKQPKLVYEVKPQYTREAMDAGIQGTLTLEAVIDEAGAVEAVEVTRSLDAVYGLDDAAVRAAKQWRFEPGTKDDKPVAVRVEIEMSFRLK